MFKLSPRSVRNLVGVHEVLISTVHRAIEISEVDFSIRDDGGLRTIEAQTEKVRAGNSKTLNSRHLTGHAVDLTAIVNGQPSWDWDHYYKIAKAMQTIAREKSYLIVWGGVWDRLLSDLGSDLKEEVVQYIARMKKLKGPTYRVLTDGPHFELRRKEYPA